ncbi:MAG TPA: HAD-IA family hydrolase [Hyphomicrobiales bacterium]|nr:HAD-IA family hydrolase [Hyphomicrobiales bacterium]
MLRAVLFDLDGTLLDTQPDFSVLVDRLLSEHGLPAADPLRLNPQLSSGARAMLRACFELEDCAPQLDTLTARFLEDYQQLIPQTQAALFADIDLLLSDLVERGLPWGIMTNKARRFSAPLLTQFESFATCAALVCPDDVGKGKPDPAGLLHLCEQLQVAPADAVYVGDHRRDIDAAKSAGMTGIAAAWGYLATDENLTEWGASFIATTPAELRAHLAALGAR